MSSPALDRQLVAYTLAGGAGMLAAGSADAAIIYSGLLNQSVTVGSSYAIDFDGFFGTDLTFSVVDFGSRFDARSSAASGFGVADNTADGTPTNFASGDLIDGGSKYTGSSTKTLAAYDTTDGAFIDGNFPANATGFLGFVLSGNNFGWVRLSFGGTLDATTGFTVIDWAYDNTGAAIRAGQTTSAVPGAGALAALAVGASGLRGRRSRERAA
jgi:hypothetical protein